MDVVKGKLVKKIAVSQPASTIVGQHTAVDEMDDDHLLGATTNDPDDKKKKGSVNVGVEGIKKSGGGGAGGSGGGAISMKCCQAEKCAADLSDAKQYHKRHKVCEYHAKAQVVVVGGIRQRFCQQCSRFHELLEFDDSKRSCRRRLAGHNERRRKSSSEGHAEGSERRGGAPQMKDMVCGQVDDRGRIQMLQDNSTFKHFQIR